MRLRMLDVFRHQRTKALLCTRPYRRAICALALVFSTKSVGLSSGWSCLHLVPALADSILSENKTFVGGEEYLKSRGVEVVVLNNVDCYQLMQTFIKEHPEAWYVEQARRAPPG